MSERERLERAKHRSTLQLLIRAARRVDERARARVNAEAGRIVARPATMALVPHIALEGTRIVDLAEKLGISKQAVSRRVQELVEAGLLELATDPTDARARLVRFTPEGVEAIHQGIGVLVALERELADEIGEEAMAGLREGLVRLEGVLDSGG